MSLLLGVLVFQSAICQTQTANTDHLTRLQLNDALDPPQNILSSKSIVLISVPTGSGFGEWKNYAGELQAFLAQEGIDAVACFNVARQRTVAGLVQDLPKYMLERDISNLIFYIVGDEERPSVLGIGPFNGKASFYDAGAIFWTREFNNIEGVFNELSTLFKTGAFARTNLLVNEGAEFFDFVKPSFANNYASFPPELEKRKIAIPILYPYPSGAGSHLLSADHFYNPTLNAETTSAWNQALDALVADSLFDAQRVDMSKTTDALLRRDGFTHVLNFVETDSEYLYQLFSYKKREEIEATNLVKFYLKDLSNSNVFLGRSWDAQPDWQQALTLFVEQMKKELPVEGG